MPERECIFCKIAKKELDSEVIDENDKVIVVNDIHPKAPVHLLIISKLHIPSLKEVSVDTVSYVADMVLVAQKTAKAKRMKGYKLVFNVGKEGGQVIDHLHLHLLGGWEETTNKVEV
jgi:histidine triad (HIT) family protein